MRIVDLDRDELALRIAQGCLGMIPPQGTNATEALDEMDRVPMVDPGAPKMGQGFRRAADLVLGYIVERSKSAQLVQ